MRPSRSLVVIALAGLVALAGCSGGVSPTGTTAAEPTTTTPQPTQAQGSGSAPNGTLEVHFINVGQSVATLVISPEGETMLIDTGDYRDDGKYVLQYLRNHDITRLDHLVVSHNDADHIGGNAAIINYYETEANGIGAVYDPGIAASTQTYEAYLDAVERHDVTLYETRAGDRLPFAGVDVDVLGPPEPYLENRARNENSIVLKLTFGKTSFLLTGDAEDDQEAYLVEKYGSQLEATVLKAGHHGSKSSTSGALLDTAQPEAVVISSAYDSQYGHPHEEVLQRLAARSIPTYWTATHGDIVLVSDGSTVTISTQASAPTTPTALRSGDPIPPSATTGVTRRATITASGDATTIIADGGTTTTDGTTTTGRQLTIERIHADADGDDRTNLNDEYVVFTNTGTNPIDLSGWTVSDEAGHTYTFPDGTTLNPGDTLTLHTGSGTNTDTDLYWGAGSPIWNNGGDTVIVKTPDCDTISKSYA